MLKPTNITSVELAQWIEEEVSLLDSARLAAWERIRVAPFLAPIERPSGIERAWVVAVLPDERRVFFDDWEEGFEVARLDTDGVLRGYGGSKFELIHITTWTLENDAG